ncbi:hypothetical protein [Nocardioides terrisoli]|uniref:hypothetical protein n=1 Tax=Nocardioides terrisoli TaxID=3388267 RepID=UPI00287B7FF5|nr:hypothetical protein [Nocardioides marmorisolisilvae]
MPTADDLFRRTAEEASGETTDRARLAPAPEPGERRGGNRADETSPRRPSGRVRHDEKMTVYVTADELLDIEHARLALRRDQGLAVDRGRLVREAIALALADLDEHGDESAIVQRLMTS